MVILFILLSHLSLSSSSIEKAYIPYEELKYNDSDKKYDRVIDSLEYHQIPIERYVEMFTERKIQKAVLKFADPEDYHYVQTDLYNIKKKQENDPLNLIFNPNVPKRIRNIVQGAAKQRNINGTINIELNNSYIFIPYSIFPFLTCYSQAKDDYNPYANEYTISLNKFIYLGGICPLCYLCKSACPLCKPLLTRSIHHEITHVDKKHSYQRALYRRPLKDYTYRANEEELARFNRSQEAQADLMSLVHSTREDMSLIKSNLSYWWSSKKKPLDLYMTQKKLYEHAIKISKLKDAHRRKYNSGKERVERCLNSLTNMYYYFWQQTSLIIILSVVFSIEKYLRNVWKSSPAA